MYIHTYEQKYQINVVARALSVCSSLFIDTLLTFPAGEIDSIFKTLSALLAKCINM